jgi:hypothetical protein
MPKVAVIVIAFSGSYYDLARSVWGHYRHINANVDVYMVYGRLEAPIAKVDINDLVFDDVQENLVPGVLIKTIYAMRFVLSKKNYDFIIRTNLSTFWDFDGLLRELMSYPALRHYSGFGPVWPGRGYDVNGFYASGADMVMSRDVVESVLTASPQLRYELPDDAAIGLLITNVLKIPLLATRRMHPIVDLTWYADDSEIVSRIEIGRLLGRNRFRVKNCEFADRFTLDGRVFDNLLKIVYPSNRE